MPNSPKPTNKIIAVIVAGGVGSRFGVDLPKQYHMLAGKSVLRRSCEIFLAHPNIDAVQVVIHKDASALYKEATDGLELLDPVFGGKTRQASVLSGLKAIQTLEPNKVLIHDAARPSVTSACIDRILDALKNYDAAIPTLAVSETLNRVSEDGLIVESIDRTNAHLVQTPQGFDFKICYNAHQQARSNDFTDDASLVMAQDIQVKQVAGDLENRKITTMQDLQNANLTIQHSYESRTGFGYDVHAFEPPHQAENNSIMLCGVAVPHDVSLKGHSDADVGLHALTDALLGTIADGDIGQHFSPKDERWKDADSTLFLQHAASLIAEKGGVIVHADITIIGERPKVGPYRAAMQEHIAKALGISASRISIKATTTEKLGFLGRGEGLAAQAIATVKLPRNY